MSIKDWLEPITNDKERAEITARYIKVFGTTEGRLVLTDILVNLGFFDYNQTDPVALERMNFARFLLKRLGIFDPVRVDTIVSNLMQLSTVPKKTSGNRA